MPLEPITRTEQFYARIAGDGGKVLEPITRTEHFLQRIIEVGGGGEVTAEAVAAAISQFSAAQAAAARDDLGAAQADVVETISGATPSITPVDGTIYKCGTLTSLTIANPPATGAWSVVFTSGATATTTTIPSTILGLEDFAAEENTLYEINVLDNRAVVGSWAVSST